MRILYLGPESPLIDWLASREGVIYRTEKAVSEVGFDKLHFDFVISYNYRHILGKQFLEHVDYRAINLHTSFLPWNRGTHPNVWSFINGTPKGVTIHFINGGIDTGDIIFQKQLTYDSDKLTLFDTYSILQNEAQSLFKKHWDEIRVDYCPRFKQVNRFPLNKKSDLGSIIFPSGWNTTIRELLDANRNFNDIRQRVRRSGENSSPEPSCVLSCERV